jgi:amino acid adenylation domain-containing protein
MDGLFSILSNYAIGNSEKSAFIFLEDGDSTEVHASYGELKTDSARIAKGLIDRGLHQKTVLLVYPPGIEYIKAFLACQASGAIAVPIYPPRSSRHANRLIHVINDCQASAILTTNKYRDKLKSFGDYNIDKVHVFTVDEIQKETELDHLPYQSAENISFIQYTSGSTGNPKGVIVTNENLLTNEEQIREAILQTEDSVIVSWLPMYHDMGLIGNILHNIYIGSQCVFFSPVHFLQQPMRWLRAISKYKATLSGAPNFAYDVLNTLNLQDEKIDLSSLEVAFNGSEKVRADTLQRFAEKYREYGLNPNAIYPCYGLAEATLMVSGYQRGDSFKVIRTTEEEIKSGKIRDEDTGEVELVSSGKVRSGIDVLIVDSSLVKCHNGTIGEICIAGNNVSAGYWGGRGSDSFFSRNGQKYTLTGDLGCLVNDELFITGRKKELIIRNGVNYYPYDIERTVSNAHTGLVMNGCAVFSVDDQIKERIVVIAEVTRTYYRELDKNEVLSAINAKLSDEFGFEADDILLIKPMSLPKTSSGKIRRSSCKDLYSENGFDYVARLTEDQVLEEEKSVEEKIDLNISDSSDRLLLYLGKKIGGIIHRKVSLNLDDNLHSLGLDSLKLMQFIVELESEFDVRLDLNEVYEDHTIRTFIQLLKSAKIETYDTTNLADVSVNQQALWLGCQNELLNNNIGISFSLEGKESYRNRLNSSLQAALTELKWTGINFSLENDELRTTSNSSLFDEIFFDSMEAKNERLKEIYDSVIHTKDEALIKLVIFEDASNRRTHCTIICHHIVSDGWSLGILFKQLLQELNGTSKKTESVTYSELIKDEAAVLTKSDLIDQAQTFFNDSVQIENLNQLLHPIDFSTQQKETIDLHFDNESLVKLAGKLQLTPYLLLLGVFQYSLSFLSSSESICSVTPVSRRSSKNRQNMFGYLANLMYLSNNLSKEDSIQDYFERLKANYKMALKYQEVPYSHLLRNADLNQNEIAALGEYYFAYQSFEGMPEFQKLFGEEGVEICTLDEGTLVKSVQNQDVMGNFQMELELFEHAKSTNGVLKFNRSHFSSEFGQELMELMKVTLDELSQVKDFSLQRLCELNSGISRPSISHGEKLQLEHINFLEQFREAVKAYPNNIAVVKGQKSYTYRQLDEASDTIAKNLRSEFNVQTDTPVFVVNNREVEDILAIIGVMKAGGVYAPVENDIPALRLEEIAESSKIYLLISNGIHSVLPSGCHKTSTEILLRQNDSKTIIDRSKNAYIIHTSGTTGKPKGVLIEQQSLVNLNNSLTSEYRLTEYDRVLQFSALSFDMSVEEIFPILSIGGAVVLREEEIIDSLDKFKNFCEVNGITVLNLPTEFWNETLYLEALPRTVRLISVGGQRMKGDIVEEWIGKFGNQAELFNAYGPTEYTVNASLCRLTAAKEVTIGKPVNNTSMYILNSLNKTVPVGIVGEIGISGRGMTAGYIMDAFPLKSFVTVNDETRMTYLTGDLGYSTFSGEIVVLGRKDTQEKIRGFRVELGEVEARLLELPEITASVAIVQKGNIHAFIVTNTFIKAEEIEERISHYLPKYMIPQFFYFLDKIPVNVRGKVDLTKLRELYTRSVMELEPPQTDIEKKLCDLWMHVLDLDEIGISVNFFEAGGHSIKAIKLISRMEREFGIQMDIKTLYKLPTIKSQAQYIETMNWIEEDPSESHQREQGELFI